MATKSKNQQPAVTEKPIENNKTKIVGKYNSKYKDIAKLTGIIRKKK